MSGSGISWAICTSAPRSRQITTPAPHHSSVLQAGCPSCHPTNSVKALKAHLTAKRRKKVKIFGNFIDWLFVLSVHGSCSTAVCCDITRDVFVWFKNFCLIGLKLKFQTVVSACDSVTHCANQFHTYFIPAHCDFCAGLGWKFWRGYLLMTRTHARTHAHTDTNSRLTALFPGRPRWAGSRKVNQSGFYWSKRQWVAVASAGPHASLHLAPDR